MKNLQTFDEFLNEAKMLSPNMVKEFDLNPKSANELKKYSFKLGNDFIKIGNADYFADKSDLLDFLTNIKNGNLTNTWFPIERFPAAYGDWKGAVHISKNEFELDKNSIELPATIQQLYSLIQKANGDILKGLIMFFDESFKLYGDQIEKHINEMLGLPVVYAMKAGEISPATGKTGHGWSIYDNKNGQLAYNGNSGVLSSAGEFFEVGKSYKVLDDQTHKVLWAKFTVKEIIKTNYTDFVNFSKRTGAKIPIGSYQKQPGTFSYTIYTLK